MAVVEIRRLTAEDVATAVEISTSAGWNQTAADWSALIALNPETSFGIDCEGRLVSTATLVCYGDRLAWVGMVLTRAEFRRQGFARLLLERVLGEAEARGVRTVKLDATEQGAPLYAALGFIAEQPVERWVMPKWVVPGRDDASPRAASARALAPGARVPDALAVELDTLAFGTDRETVLLRLGQSSQTLTAHDGYAMRRDGQRAAYLGPCVARTPQAAKRLIHAALRHTEGPCVWDLLPENANAVRLARKLGFTPERRLVRMFRGEPLRAKEGWIYALAGFELG